jgi:hypothetical protein
MGRGWQCPASCSPLSLLPAVGPARRGPQAGSQPGEGHSEGLRGGDGPREFHCRVRRAVEHHAKLAIIGLRWEFEVHWRMDRDPGRVALTVT